MGRVGWVPVNSAQNIANIKIQRDGLEERTEEEQRFHQVPRVRCVSLRAPFKIGRLGAGFWFVGLGVAACTVRTAACSCALMVSRPSAMACVITALF